jgi:hypothetical protein
VPKEKGSRLRLLASARQGRQTTSFVVCFGFWLIPLYTTVVRFSFNQKAAGRGQLAAALFGRSVAMSCLDDLNDFYDFYAFYDFYGFNDLQLATLSDRDEKCLLN